MRLADEAGGGASLGCRSDRPKGVAERAEGLLRDHSYRALRRVTCEFRDGTLTLGGRLPSYYLKQVAQTVAAQVEGVQRLVNRIEIAPPSRVGA